MSVSSQPTQWQHPKPAWIAMLILGFLISWPVGVNGGEIPGQRGGVKAGQWRGENCSAANGW